MANVYEMIGTGLIVYLAFWQKDMILYYIAGIISIILASNWLASYPGVTVAVWFLGVYMIILGQLVFMETGGPARGFAQLKSMFKRDHHE